MKHQIVEQYTISHPFTDEYHEVTIDAEGTKTSVIYQETGSITEITEYPCGTTKERTIH